LISGIAATAGAGFRTEDAGVSHVSERLPESGECGCIPPGDDVRTFHMSWSRDNSGGGRRGYHHGNLREALVRAALDLIAEKGPFGFTFADAARSAGVSSAAPYRHYRDRDALVADVARRGFDLFAAQLDRAWNEGQPDAFTAFEAIGRAYLRFARDEPAYYSAMFEAGIPLDEDLELRDAADRAIAPLRKASEALCAELPPENRPPPRMMSLHIWSLSHGIASLFARGDAGRRKLPMAPEELLEAAVLIYLQGLGFRGGLAKKD
jgi:AcrR family transcriptional regulator